MLMFSYLMATGITTGAFYALVALGIVIVYKSTEVVNLAHGELFMVGGMLAYTCYVMAGIPYLPSLLLAVAGAFVVGLLTERVAYRSVLRHGLASVLVATIGISFILKGIGRYVWGGKGDYLAFPPIVSPEPLQFANIMIMSQQLVVLLAAMLLMGGLALFFTRTRAGKWMQATASNPKAAMLCGLRIDRIYMYTFAVGAAVAGAAGVLMAPLTLLYPDVGFVLFIKGLAAAVLGGITSASGAVVGGIALGIIEQLAAGYVHSSIEDLVPFLVIMLVLTFLPRGLFGVRRPRRV
jgi:branched-chain amino acid transport system permease protein